MKVVFPGIMSNYVRFVTYNILQLTKMQRDEGSFIPISCSTFRRPGYLASKITSVIMTMFTKCETNRIWHVIVKFLVLK